MNLILLKQNELEPNGQSVVLRAHDPRAKHILHHLRKKPGDEVSIGIVGGRKGKAIVRLHATTGVGCWLDCFQFDQNEEMPKTTLLLAMPFPRRLKSLWAQIAAFGVTRICIVRAALSDGDHCKSSTLKKEEYDKLILEGMAQGCHTREVDVDIKVDEVISAEILRNLGLGDNYHGARVFLDCGDEHTVPKPCRNVLRNQLSVQSHFRPCAATIAIGPERGWTDDEARLFSEAGFAPATLGKSILRVDTAVVAALGIVSATLDELAEEFGAGYGQNAETKRPRTT